MGKNKAKKQREAQKKSNTILTELLLFYQSLCSCAVFQCFCSIERFAVFIYSLFTWTVFIHPEMVIELDSIEIHCEEWNL